MSVEIDAELIAMALCIRKDLLSPGGGTISFLGSDKKYTREEFFAEMFPKEDDKREALRAGAELDIATYMYEALPIPRRAGSPHIDIEALQELVRLPPDRLKAGMIRLAENAVRLMFGELV